jgi:hypothetical protein
VLCSGECADALTAGNPELLRLLAREVHGACAAGALRDALTAILRAQRRAREHAALPAVNAALLLVGSPVLVADGGSAAEHAEVVHAAFEADRPLQQAVLHLAALRAYRVPIDAHLAAVSGCNVEMVTDPAVVHGVLGVFEERIRLAGRALSSLGFAPG